MPLLHIATTPQCQPKAKDDTQPLDLSAQHRTSRAEYREKHWWATVANSPSQA